MHLDPTTWPVWPDLPRSERLVQLAAYHCDVLHVREEPESSNRGPWVDRYLAAAGVEPGNPWCAAFVTFLAGVAGYDDLPSHPAAVASWAHWARDTRRRRDVPRRGDLFYILHPSGTGHMGIVLSPPDGAGQIRTIEGNTNEGGGREGYEVARRERHARSLKFIRL